MTRRLATLILPLMLSATPISAEVIEVDSSGLQKLLAGGVPIVDVRSPRDCKRTGVVKGSHQLSFYDLFGRYDMDRWVSDLRAIAGPEDPVILICNTGRLTVGIAEYLDKRAGYSTVYHVKHGIKRWIADGQPTVPPETAS
jgi:rhodanese-related sulfurtransferase